MSNQQLPNKPLNIYHLYSFVPIINVIFAIIFLNTVVEQLIQLILYFLVFLSISSEIYFLQYSQFGEKNKENNIPYIDEFITKDLSARILLFSQVFYSVIFLYLVILGYLPNFIGLTIFYWIYFGLCFFATLSFALILFDSFWYMKKIQKAKIKTLNDLKKIFHECDDKNYEVKNYYLQIILELRDRPVFTIKPLSKLLTAITIILSFIPFIL